jgi:protocatechuate 3,4-dioxygenase beta subunit
VLYSKPSLPATDVQNAADPSKDWGRAHEEIEMQSRKFNRRELIGAMGAAAGAAVAFGCGSSPTSPTETTTPTTTTMTGTNSACAVTPTETVGPYPSLTDLFRSDIREGKSGTQLTLTVKVVNVNSSCAAVSGANVEIWHVDAAGNYSQYGSQTTQTYLRGIQTTNSNGEVTFTTIYPGWYQGRATHIHLEVTMNGRSVKVTQIAFPESINNTVHATGAYASRGSNPMSNASDGIFADSLSSELISPTGDSSGGYSATFQVGVAV